MKELRAILTMRPIEEMTILIVDDSPMSRTLISNHLVSAGFTKPLEADSVDATATLLGLETPEGPATPVDLILFDVILPGVDGIEGCHRVKTDPRYADTPVIMITASDRRQTLDGAFAAGAMDFIPKPTDKVELMARVTAALKLKREIGLRRIRERELEQLNIDKNRILGMVAHDLRNPIGSIRIFAELLLRGELTPEKEREFLFMIRDVARDAQSILSDLLDFSAIEAGAFEMKLVAGDVASVVKRVVAIHQILATNKQITIELTLQKTPPVSHDPIKLGQAVDNLLSNAIKYGPKGSIVQVTVTPTESGVAITVVDEGPGIAPEEVSELFGVFKKLTAAPTGGEKSHGLGLAIVRKIVEAHNGVIQVSRAPHQGGALFTLLLPPAP